MKERRASALRSTAAHGDIAGDGAALQRQGDQLAAFYWVDDKLAYVVSGPADRDRLKQVTRAVYEQIDRSGARKS